MRRREGGRAGCECVRGERERERERYLGVREQKEETDRIGECICADESCFHLVANILISQLTCEVLVMLLMLLFKLDKIIVLLAANLLILWRCHLLFSKTGSSCGLC